LFWVTYFATQNCRIIDDVESSQVERMPTQPKKCFEFYCDANYVDFICSANFIGIMCSGLLLLNGHGFVWMHELLIGDLFDFWSDSLLLLNRNNV